MGHTRPILSTFPGNIGILSKESTVLLLMCNVQLPTYFNWVTFRYCMLY
uniref:Uncharacterized protein n=1 Tax=Anguilla anguilla TaxID=7936 RepID=A0A0E9P6W8_ANGAN